MKRSKIFLFAGLLITALAGTTIVLRSTSAAAPGPSASGHGTILLQNTEGKTVRRQFSLRGGIKSDGAVEGTGIVESGCCGGREGGRCGVGWVRVVGRGGGV